MNLIRFLSFGLFIVLLIITYVVFKSPASKAGTVDCGNCSCCQSSYRHYACDDKRPPQEICLNSECKRQINYVKCTNQWDVKIVEIRNYYNNFLNQTR